ncbi:unnamed protein product [Amaranthus hypochondriacus]
MTKARVSPCSWWFGIVILCMTLFGQSYAQLKVGFYFNKCGTNNVEQIIFDIVTAAFQNDRTIVAALLRMQFHDCFVRGCDASLLLDGSTSEKNAGANASVRGFELIDACKARLEQLCPGTVSCADIITIATRVAVFQAGGRWYNVETGRRDGSISNVIEAQNNLPGPTVPVANAITLFNSKGLNVTDFVLLLGGGHTVGVIHCNFFLDRLYNFQNTGRPDPSMNTTTLTFLQSQCPPQGSSNFVFADQTRGSEFRVDKAFYDAIRLRKGVLQLDQRIAQDTLTASTVNRLSLTGDFTLQFHAAMIKLARVGVLTGSQGQIRRNCHRIN